MNSTDLQKKAEMELNEIPAEKQAVIEAFRKMVMNDSTLNCPLDDEFLLRYLRARKFNTERALKLLQNYYFIRMNYSEIYLNFVPSAVKYLFKNNIQTVLPQRDQNGCRVFVMKPGNWDPAISHDELFRINQMCLEKLIWEEETQINGIVQIIDLKGLGMQYSKYLTVDTMKKITSLLQDCLPARFKAMHIVNESPTFNMLMAIAKQFLTEKFNNRIYCHGTDFSSLHKHVYPQILPLDFGGYQPAMDNSAFMQSLLDNEYKFIECNQYGYQTPITHKKSDLAHTDIAGFYKKISCD